MTETAIFAAGCFWGVEAAFRRVEGVLSTSVGYTGGHAPHPTYQQVCTDTTGHAEAVRVEFDPARVSYDDLLEVFWDCHDPTQLNRQGPDWGSQYRSAIFFDGPGQQVQAEASKARRQASLQGTIVTQIVPVAEYFPAEDYHQQYLEKRGASFCGH